MFETKVSIDKNIGGFATLEDIEKNGEKVDFEKGQGKVGGVVMTSDGKTGTVFDDDGFYIVIGGTASKKTRDVVLPYIVANSLAGNSMIIMDVKGDIYKNSYKKLKEQGYKIVKLNFDEPATGDAYNPFRQMYRDYHNGKKDKAVKDLTAFSEMIFENVKSDKDPYWHVTSSSYFTGSMMTLWDLFSEEQASIANVLNLHMQGERKLDSNNTYMRKYYHKRLESPAWKLLYSAVDAPNETRSSIFSIYTSGLNKLVCQSDSLISMMSDSTFEVSDLVNEKTAIFIFANEQALSVHSNLIAAYLHQWYDILVTISTKTNGVLNRNVIFVLDEFGNLPAIKDFEKKISLSRARGISWMIVLQSVAQLKLRYGEEIAHTIISNTTNWIYLFSSDPEFRTYISNLCGETVDPVTREVRKTLTANQLRNFVKHTEDGLTECLFLLGRMKPFISFLPDITAYAGISPIESLDLPLRDESNIEAIDFCTIVETEEKSKRLEEIKRREEKRRAMREKRLEAKEAIKAKDDYNVTDNLNLLIHMLKGGMKDAI